MKAKNNQRTKNLYSVFHPKSRLLHIFYSFMYKSLYIKKKDLTKFIGFKNLFLKYF